MTTKNVVIFALGSLIVGGAIFVSGLRTGQKADFVDTAVKIDSVQAMLAFNHLEDERHWEYLLREGCIAQATKAIDVAQDREEVLLAGFMRGRLDKGVTGYMRDRNPALIDALKTFRSRYGNSWTEDACSN